MTNPISHLIYVVSVNYVEALLTSAFTKIPLYFSLAYTANVKSTDNCFLEIFLARILNKGNLSGYLLVNDATKLFCKSSNQ